MPATYYIPKSVGRAVRKPSSKVKPAPLADRIAVKRRYIVQCEAELAEAQDIGNPALILAKEHILLQQRNGLATLERMQREEQEEARKRELLDTPHWED
jgi:hypothetical protein